MNINQLLKKGYGSILLFSLLAAVIILSGCGAQAAPKVYRVGILSGLDYFAPTSDGFKAGMTDLGYVEGQNITYDVQKTNFDIAAYQRILQKFVADKVDLIVVFPTEASLEAKAATQGTDIPVVFAFAFIEGVDLVKSVREPGGNITGLRLPGPDVALKRFEVMRQLAPQAKRIWLPYQRGYPIVASQLEVLRPAAQAAGVTLLEAPANNRAELEAALQAQAAANDIGVDAILSIAEPLTVQPDVFAMLGKFAADHKIPFGGSYVKVEKDGPVYGVGNDSIAGGKQVATLANKIFKGTPAGNIPVLSAELYLQIDYKRAQELGLSVPEGLLSQADEIIR
ncbi:MAG: ABC transporter substrate-binding protein [Anaerolineae bacterium]